MKTHLITLAFLLAIRSASAQDFSFSQQFNLPQLANPAFTGMIPEFSAHRISLGYRGIWGLPWEDGSHYGYAVATDYRLCLGRSFLGLGLDAQMDISNIGSAPEATFQNSQGNFLAAYHQRLANDLTLAAGTSIGFLQYGFDPNALQFNRQFNPITGFNAAANNGESFGLDRQSQLKWDLDAGITLYKSQAQFGNPWIDAWSLGFAIHHLLHPSYSFLETKNELKAGFSLQGNMLLADRKLLLTGSFKKQSFSESKQWELLAGLVAKKFTKEMQPLHLNLGLLLRLAGRPTGAPASALTPYVAIDLESGWNLGLGYDISLSKTQSRFYGGLELTSRWRFGTVKGQKCINCPEL